MTCGAKFTSFQWVKSFHSQLSYVTPKKPESTFSNVAKKVGFGSVQLQTTEPAYLQFLAKEFTSHSVNFQQHLNKFKKPCTSYNTLLIHCRHNYVLVDRAT